MWPQCGAGRALSPLARHAKELNRQWLLDGAKAETEADPMLFPMYTLPLEELLQMTELRAHEGLKAAGLLVEFENQGQAAFISHQWVGLQHPDPEMKQLRVLQEALRHALSEISQIAPGIATEAFLPNARWFSTKKLRSSPVFVWYDYFSCPQEPADPGKCTAGGGSGALADAIDSS